MTPKTFVTILFLVLLPATPGHARQTLRLACDPWPPYQIVASDGAIGGFSTWVVRSVLQEMDIDVVITPSPWKRALRSLQANEVDGLFSIGHTPSRESFARFPDEPIILSQWIFISRRSSNLRINGYEDLRNKSIGTTLGYSYDDSFWAAVKRSMYHELVKNDELNLLKLHKKRLDVVAAERFNSRYLLKTMGISGVVEHSNFIFKNDGLYLAFATHVDDKLVQRFSDALRDFKRSKSYTDMHARYFLGPGHVAPSAKSAAHTPTQ